MRISSLTAIAVATLAVVAPVTARQTTQSASVAPTQAASGPKGDREKGKTLFTSDGCFQCHANEAQGGAAGPRIGPNPLPFPRFTAYVRAPRGDMPPYTPKVLSDQDLADIYAFLQTQPRPAAIDTIPLLAP